MSQQDIHRLLKRQIKKFSQDENIWENHSELLSEINTSYINFDKDFKHLESILEISSVELYKANQALRKERDISRNQLEYILKNVNVAIFQTDIEGKYIYLSPAWTKLTHIPIENSLGKTYLDFLSGKNSSEKEKLTQILNRNNKTNQSVFKYITIHQEEKWIEFKMSYTQDSKGVVDGSIGTFTDVTTLKNTEIALNKASKTKDDFLATMSHDMRTPLNSIIGLSNMLLIEDYLPEQLENLSTLKFSAEHLLELINGILDFNKMQATNNDFDAKEFSLNFLLDTLKGNFNFQATEKGLKFEIEKASNVPDIVLGDKVRLSQILNNLLGNALKFTEEGTIALRIKNIQNINNRVTLQFQVVDTGIGIDKEAQDEIFNKFFQLDSDPVRKNSGTGLGLAICKRLLKMQNSDIVVESELNKGTTFKFDIVYKIPTFPLPAFKSELEKLEIKNANLNLKILVAEDNKLNILVIKKFLKKWNASFMVAENGDEALELFEQNDFDVILMDLEMPIKDGYETTETIRALRDKNKSEIPIIAFTASVQEEIKNRAKKAGVNNFIAKPFEPLELYSKLKVFEK